VSGTPTSVVWDSPLATAVPHYLPTAGGTGGYLSGDGSLGVFGSFRWSAANGLTALAPAPQTNNPVGTAISLNGIIVGWGGFVGNGTPVATIWDLAGAPAQMFPGFSGIPTSVSADGSAAAGYALNAGQNAWVWNAQSGPTSLDSYFGSLGLSTVGLGLTNTLLYVSGDGSLFTGTVRISSPSSSTDGYVLAPKGLRANVAPQVALASNLKILENQALPLSGQATSSSEDPALLTYTWDLDNDGIFGETGPGATRGSEVGQNVTLSAAGLLGPATLTISSRATDTFGLTTTVARQVVVTAPAISVSGGGQPIANNDFTPRLLDGTLWNPVLQGAAFPTSSFVVQNSGTGDLQVASVNIPSGFTVVQPLPATIGSGSQATLIIALDTSAAGSYGGHVVISTNDHANGAYSFGIAGSVLATSGPAKATVLDSTTLLTIPDNFTAPSAANGTVLTAPAQGATGPTQTFVVRNDGAQPLAISNLFIPAGFTLVKGLASTIGTGQSDTLTIQLNTAVGGAFPGKVSFHTNDPAAANFDFAILGNVPQYLDLFASKAPALPSADGKTIIAVDSNTYWTEAGGVTTLPPLVIAGVTMNIVRLKSISPDGKVLGGQVALDNGNPLGDYQAFVWSQATGFKRLDGPGPNAQVMSISNNGTHASGIAYDSGVATSVIWDNPLGIAVPNTLAGTDGTGGCLSADGTLGVFGAFRWSAANGLVPLVPASETHNPVGTAISANGIIVGYGGFLANDTPVATMWDLQGTPSQLSPGFAGIPLSVSADGSIVTGYDFNVSQNDFVWKPSAGPASLVDFFTSLGLNSAGLGLTNTPLFVSSDGNTFTGSVRPGNSGATDSYVVALRGVDANTAPSASPGSGYAVLQGESIQLSATASDSGQAGDTLTYQWDLDNDGIFGESGSDASRGNENGTAPVFSAAGLIGPSTFPVYLRVTDSFGKFTTVSTNIQINQPTISLSTNGLENAGALNRGNLPLAIPYSVAGATGPTGTFKWTQPSGLTTPVYISYSFSNLLDGTLPGGLSTNQIRAAAEQAMSLWAAAAPLVFVEVPDSGPDPRVIGNGDYPAAGNPMIRFGQRNIVTDLALTNLPNSASSGQSGDVNFNSSITSWALAPQSGVDMRQVFLHEIGIALGLNVISGQSPSIMAAYDGRFTGGNQPQLNALDVQAIQGVYGAGAGGVYSLFPAAIPLAIADAPLLAGLSLTGVRVFGVPAGAALSAGTSEGNGTWFIQPYQLQGLMVRPPANFHGTFTLPFTVYVADATTRQGNIDVSVAAVAYPPTLIVNGTAHGDAGTPIHLPVQASFAVPAGDDGVLSLVVSGVPLSATVSGGTSLGNGAWAVDPAQLSQFAITPSLDASNFNLTLTATDLQTSNGATASSFVTLPVTVIPVLSDAFEPFDNTQPTFLPRDVIQSHSISGSGDVDWYTFNILRDNSDVNLRVRSPNDASTPLFANLALTLYSDAAATNVLAQVTGDLVMTMAAGQYYLKVQHAQPAGVANYTIQLGISDPSATAPILVGTAPVNGPGRDFFDDTVNYPLNAPNPQSTVANSFADNRVSAGVPVLSIGTQLAASGVARSIYAAGDVDWAQFTLPSRSVVNLTAFDPNVISSPTASIFNNHPSVPAILCLFNGTSSGATQIANVFDDNSAAPTVQSKFQATLDPGTYFVLVYRYNNTGTIAHYDLNLAVTPTADASRPLASIVLGSGQSSPTSASAVSFVANFSKPVTGFTGAGLILPAGVSASVTPMNATGNFAASYAVLATGITASTAVSIGLADGAARDASGNASLAVAPGAPTVIVNKTGGAVFQNAYLFYKGSTFDSANHDTAIAPGKLPLLPGQTATFANYSSYTRGINGLMIDIATLAGTPTTSDFVFKTGNDSSTSSWIAATLPVSVTTRSGQGAGGSSRIELTWADNAIQDQWLQVTVKATANTGLSSDVTFYFGNAIGEAGTTPADAKVNATDELAARFGATPSALISSPVDFNRDGIVDGTDQTLARANYTYFLHELKL
ncbi:MAG TPA: choice-of-anchor D domain-containing protein, partial [Phycisphaerae bacterium]|nr:choice-of-anchor D domain-containing protein [Phycisphaerae bacterium]